MTRLAKAFPADRAALITFVTVGDPTPVDMPAILDALVEGGADIIELGMPFTDPMADGPTIQAANIRSLAAGTKTADTFSIASAFRKRHPDVPLVLMGYANPMTIRGADWFADSCAKAGIDGVICVDIPVEEDDSLGDNLREKDIAIIRLATPTTDTDRLPAILNNASGFLYYVSVAGITGLQQAAQVNIEEAVYRLKAGTDLPVAVGFGIRTPDQAADIARIADGVIVGSATVEIIAEHGANAAPYVKNYIKSLSDAIRSAR
ncbi:tryptophan synthase subunit alpha [Parasphingorhabdus sp. JC815]|uniref:tryptophan synthase subunit alpha n=1 Tax=Parasphingorhabdus sp. JC815 TaxID=3232140 RepID=UPI00345B35E8